MIIEYLVKRRGLAGKTRGLKPGRMSWLRRGLLLWLVLAVVIFVITPVVSWGGEPIAKGPLQIVGETPLQTMRLNSVPERHDILPTGRYELSLKNAWTNRWNNTPSFLLDLEVIQNNFGFTIGVGHRAELGLSIPIITRTGGGMDRIIADFHNLLHIDQEGRTDYPYNSMMIRYYNVQTGKWMVLLNKNDQGTALGDASLTFRTQIYRGSGWLRSVLFTGLLRFPTSNDRTYYGTGGTDFAVSLATMHYLKPFYLYSTLGYGRYGSGNALGIGLRPYQLTFFGAVEWPVSRDFSFVVQELSNSGVAKDYYDFSSPTHELLIGAKQRLSSHLMLQYGVIENLFVFENSVDFGLSLGVSYRP
jgi:hypothetical protein